MSRKRRSTSARPRPAKRPPVKVPWWKRPLVWVGSVLSALALGVAGAFGSGLGQSLFSTAAGQQPSQSDTAASPDAAALPPTSTSASGLDIQSSTFWLPGVNTFFVTKNTFQPTGQVAATLTNAPSIAYLSIFRNAGAVNQSRTVLRLIFTGESRQGIRILNITPIILMRAAPWHGDLFEFPLQGVAPTLNTDLDLDGTFPAVKKSATGQPYFEENTITLRQGEQQVVIMQVDASRGFVAYKLQVDYLVGTQQRDAVISDHGQPFELSAANCIRKNFESYGLVFAGIVANLSSARLPSQFQSSCLPNLNPGSEGGDHQNLQRTARLRQSERDKNRLINRGNRVA
jgi:hypothetical protein